MIVLPQRRPGSHANPKLAGEVRSVINVQDEIGQVPGFVLDWRVRQIDVSPLSQIHPIEEHAVQAYEEQKTLSNASLDHLSQTRHQVAQKSSNGRKERRR